MNSSSRSGIQSSSAIKRSVSPQSLPIPSPGSSEVMIWYTNLPNMNISVLDVGTRTARERGRYSGENSIPLKKEPGKFQPLLGSIKSEPRKPATAIDREPALIQQFVSMSSP